MSYPQPNADKYALGGYRFFRLNTLLTSDGDIYESPQGAMGFAIGPDSDISKVNIAYFDQQAPGFMSQVAISPERAFPGEILARNDAAYAPSSRPGRTLIWPDELYNPNYFPSQIADAGVNGRVDFITPVLDVVQYFAPAGLSMNQGRNDKRYVFDFIPVPTVSGIWALIVPFYGRRFASIYQKNDQAAQITVIATGLTYQPGTGAAGAAPQTIFTTNIASAASANLLVKSSTHGMFDALQLIFLGVNINSSIRCTLRIVVSDKEP